jgi:hypothetical protein
MIYPCSSCLKEFKSNWHLTRHNERKFPCKAVLKEVYESTNQPKTTQKPPGNHPKTTRKPPGKSSETLESVKRYECEHCSIKFKQYNSLSRHKTNLRCKKMNKIEMSKIIKKTNNIVTNNPNNSIILNNSNTFNNSNNNSNNNNVTNNINNTNNNIINSNNNITININPFGKENIDSITEKEKIHVLNNLYLAMPQAMKMIHYDIPENRNFFISNKREKKYITVFDGTHTTYNTSTKMKDKICSKVMNYLEEWFNTYQLKLLKNKKKILGDVFNSYYDGKLNDQYFSEVEKFLLSYSADIKKGIDDTLRKIKLEKQKQR